MPAMNALEETEAPESAGAKERLTEAAIRLFCQRGFEGTSIREIVEAAEVTKPSLYYYFRNKEGLFQNIIEDALNEFARKLEDAGYIACSKYFDGRLPKTEYKLTPAGRRALENYLSHMETLIQQMRKS